MAVDRYDDWHKKLSKEEGLSERALLSLSKELGLTTHGELLLHFPHRYDDRTTFSTLAERPKEGEVILFRAVLGPFRRERTRKRVLLFNECQGQEGKIKLLWMNKTREIASFYKEGVSYVVSGKVSFYEGNAVIIHPEVVAYAQFKTQGGSFRANYPTTAHLATVGLSSKGIGKVIQRLIRKMEGRVPETLPFSFLEKYKLPGRWEALRGVHCPSSLAELQAAQRRLKFEELFLFLWKQSKQHSAFLEKRKSVVLDDMSLVKRFCEEVLPFPLTTSQAKVVDLLCQDLRSGYQMHRLLQGDVGSGKTIVAFVVALLAIAKGRQVVVMVPTEILAGQHAQTMEGYGEALGIRTARLTGSTTKRRRKALLEALERGEIDLLVGTHALLEEGVRFAKLGMVIIDEQHRFGVAQRGMLWEKQKGAEAPHLLVMTATPIPRTLALSLYSHLQMAVIDQLPPGRKPVQTFHCKDQHRLRLFGFLRKKIKEGWQVYIVYPLIDASKKKDYKYLMDGYESVVRAFPDTPIGILHGRMRPKDKAHEMERFARGETKVLVATTVIEVGVNVPNATVMVIESAEQFGLVALHQLRGRIKRGNEPGYCILMTADVVGDKAMQRVDAMLKSENGFEIAEIDMKLRGCGNLVGVEQSGKFQLKIASFEDDLRMLREARKAVDHILATDPTLTAPDYAPLKRFDAHEGAWGHVS